ncbi:MAG: hypothetical protein RR440_03785 [Erysipelotrichaceae bacterium]
MKPQPFLEDIWGNDPLFAMSQDQFEIIKEQYPYYASTSCTIDDITWNDLELDKVFLHMNSTLCNGGDFALYQMLRTPCMNAQELKQRSDIMNWAIKYPEEREQVKLILFDIDKRYQDRMERVLNTSIANPFRRNITVISITLCVLCFVLIPVFKIMLIPAAILLVFNIFRSFYLHKELSEQIDALVYCIAHVNGLHKLAKLKFTGLSSMSKQMSDLSKQLRKVQSTSALDYFDSDKPINGLTNFILQREALNFDKYAQNIFEHADSVKKAIMCVGELDALIAAASYQVKMKANSKLKLIENDSKIHISARKMIHPMIKNAIPNDVDIYENRLITGSNATGKSSYLKMISINAIFAQCFHFVFCVDYEASYFHIVSSMALKDNLFASESYFVTEIKSLKRMLDSLNNEVPTLCIIDEILKGTNTLERIAASSEILKTFANKNCIVLGATHDIELTKILEDEYANYHFKESMKGEQMSFDYKIHKGPSTSRNAIALLNLLGYRKDIVSNASKRLKAFETKGTWDPIID